MGVAVDPCCFLVNRLTHKKSVDNKEIPAPVEWKCGSNGGEILVCYQVTRLPGRPAFTSLNKRTVINAFKLNCGGNWDNEPKNR